MRSIQKSKTMGIILCLALLAAGSSCSREQSEQRKASSVPVNEANREAPGSVPGTSGSKFLPGSTVLSGAGDYAADFESPFPTLLFSERGNSVAYVAKKEGKFYVVFNGRAGKPCFEVDHLNISPDGLRVAHSCRDARRDEQREGKRRIVLDGKNGTSYEDVWYPSFSPDSRHIAYIAQTEDRLSHIVVDGSIGEGFANIDLDPVFSADSAKVVYVESPADQPSRLVVSDLKLRKLFVRNCQWNAAVLNKQKTRVAAPVIEDGGKLRVIQVDLASLEETAKGPLFDEVYNLLAFGSDGTTLAYAAKRGEEFYVVLNNTEEHIPPGLLSQPPVVRPDNKAVGVLMRTGDGVYFTEVFGGSKKKEKIYKAIYYPIYSSDSRYHAYVAQNDTASFMVVNGREGPGFDSIVDPRFSPDGKYLVYRARKAGKRFVVVADQTGKALRQHPGYDEVHQAEFTADGKGIAYGVRDGDKLIWKVEEL